MREVVIIEAVRTPMGRRGGVEWMPGGPMGATARQARAPPFTRELMPKSALTPQGIPAEEIAGGWGISRQEADEFARESQERARRARDEGRFEREILPMDV